MAEMLHSLRHMFGLAWGQVEVADQPEMNRRYILLVCDCGDVIAGHYVRMDPRHKEAPRG